VRVNAEETLNGGMLGTFAIIMIVSLTWVVVAYDRHPHDTLPFLRSLIYFASAFVVLLLCTSSYTYLAAVTNGVSGWTIAFIYLIGLRAWIAAVVSGSASGGRLRAWAKRQIGRVHIKGLAALLHALLRGVVALSCWAALGYLAAASVTEAVVLA